MGLSDAQKQAVGSSWAKASAAWGQDGPKFFLQLWNEHPGTYPFFKDSLFKGKDLKDVDAKSGELASQAAAFHGLVDAWVKAIDDDATLTGLCNNFAEKHEKRQISKAQVKAAFDCFVKFCGANYGADAGAWNAVVDVLMGKISGGLSR